MFPVQALRLAGNDLFRDLLADADGHVSTARGMLAGAGAGCMQVIASNPMEITKIRLQVQNTLPLAERKNVTGSAFHLFLWRVVLRELGLRGVYKGSSITLLRDVPFLMMFFPLQASLVQAVTPQHGSCSIGGLFTAGYLAGMTSAFVCTPLTSGLSISDSHGCNENSCAIGKGLIHSILCDKDACINGQEWRHSSPL